MAVSGAMWPAVPSKRQTHKFFFAVVDVVIVGILASFRLSRRLRNLSEVGPSSAPRRPWEAHSARFLIFSRRTPPHEDFSDRGSSPHVSPGYLPIGRSYGGLGFRWRLLRSPDNTVTSGWGNLSPKAEGEGSCSGLEITDRAACVGKCVDPAQRKARNGASMRGPRQCVTSLGKSVEFTPPPLFRLPRSPVSGAPTGHSPQTLQLPELFDLIIRGAKSRVRPIAAGRSSTWPVVLLSLRRADGNGQPPGLCQ